MKKYALRARGANLIGAAEDAWREFMRFYEISDMIECEFGDNPQEFQKYKSHDGMLADVCSALLDKADGLTRDEIADEVPWQEDDQVVKLNDLLKYAVDNQYILTK